MTRAMLPQGEPRVAAVNFDRAYVSEFYNGIVRFLCRSTAFLYTSATVQMLKLHTARSFSRPWCKITVIVEKRRGSWIR